MQSLLRVQALVLSAAMISACGLSNSTKADTETPVLKGLSGLQGGDYSVGVLNTGMEVYTDRPYVVTKVPASLEGAQFIQTPNNHKKVRVNQALSFELQKKADVFVAYDPRWLQCLCEDAHLDSGGPRGVGFVFPCDVWMCVDVCWAILIT